MNRYLRLTDIAWLLQSGLYGSLRLPLKQPNIMHNITDKEFRERLNPEQYRAVTHLTGPVLVIAGAGSGKTRTLVYRVARLIMEGIVPESILLLTFTRKAAASMLRRAAAITGPECSQVEGGTFHSFAHRMLRSYAHLAGYSRNFTIMDAVDTRDLLLLLAKEMELAGPGKRFPRKATISAIISKTENSSHTINEIIERYYPHLSKYREGLSMVHEAYQNYKRAHGLMDYDDLLLRWRDILLENDNVREIMGQRFQFIMVDEYQDTNPAQAEIVRLMATGHDNVMVVGDDSQSIYSFRGATINNILDFPSLFQGTTIIKLEKNYRSTQPNLDCTNAIIANAKQKFTKHLSAQRTGGTPPTVYQAKDENDQAAFVAANIDNLIRNGTDPHDIAVLFRAGFHSFSLETELNARGIIFEKRGGLRLVDAAHIKDMLSVLRIAMNPLDRLSVNRALLLLEHIGPKTAEKIFAELVKSPVPHELLSQFKSRARWADKVRELGEVILEIKSLLQNDKVNQILEIAERWYRPYLQVHYADDYPRRQQDIGQLKSVAAKYASIEEMMADFALDPPEPRHGEKTQKRRIVLSTIHSAKGLEWKAVYIISMAEGRFPSPAALNSADDIEEERRLFYVAATRAKDLLFFCYPTFINMSGAGLIPAQPCRFLQEIPSILMKSWHTETKQREAALESRQEQNNYHNSAQLSDSSSGSNSKGEHKFRPGTKVRHSTFGRGTVVQIVSKDKIKVLFDVGGTKTLHLKYAPLSVV